jgi:hypothetical protein
MMTVPTLVLAGDWDNTNWDSEVVDSFGGLSTNTGLSVALDSQGRPHVAYYALKGADLRYAVREGGTWTTETVDEYQVVGPDCSIALDAEDSPHICYYDKTNEELEYARRNGTGWDVEQVDWLGIVGVGTSIAVGPEGDVFVAYIGARTLRCGHRVNGTWNVTEVDTGQGHVYTPSLLVDAEGEPHILYIGASAAMHAHHHNGTWTVEEVAGLRGTTVAMRTTLKMDPEGKLVACFADDSATAVVIARKEGDAWNAERVSLGHYLGDMAMELDEDGEVHIALIDMAFDTDRVLVNTDVWYLEGPSDELERGVVVSSSGRGGVLLDLHLDADGDPCIALVDLDPIDTKADLTYFEGWNGEYIEAYTGEPSGNGGDGDPDDGPSSRTGTFALMVAGIIILVLIIVALVRNNGEE